jgi:hypothetical protein
MKVWLRFCVMLLSAAPIFGGGNPLVFFSPETPSDWTNGKTGMADFMQLFAANAPWANAASHVQVFSTPDSTFTGSAGTLTDTQWQQVFAYLTANNMALGVEWGPLTPEGCGSGVEGFGGQAALNMAQKFKSLGGNRQYIIFDEPFYYANIYSGTGACNWTAGQIAANALQNVAKVRTVFPNVIVGDTEPVRAAEVSDWLPRYAAWIDAWKAAAGTPFAFFHCDMHWEGPDWIADANGMRQQLAARGIPFGIIYDSQEAQKTDAGWMQDAENHFVDYELHGGAAPDHARFQSWNTHPAYVLPETAPTALTYLVDRYFRQRTSLSLSSTAGSAAGKLLDSQGGPIASVPVNIAVEPVSGPGIITTHSLTGWIPAASVGVTQMRVEVCANNCGSETTSGPSDINLYSIQYVDSGSNATQDFSKGLTGWTLQGTATRTALMQLATDSTGPSLLMQSTAAQQGYVQSELFTVTPGSPFTINIKARVSPGSVPNGWFMLMFYVNGVDAGSAAPHLFFPFDAGTAAVGTAQTASDGSYSLTFTPPAGGPFQVQAWFAGSDTLWPAFAPMAAASSAGLRVRRRP